MTAIIDYGLGNLKSVQNALDKIGAKNEIVRKNTDFSKFERMILPGVGAFKDAMNYLEQHKMKEPIINFINSKKPFLGICLGMQLLFEKSDEFGETKGLGILKGRVAKFDENNFKSHIKIPQNGWNTMKQTKQNPLFKDLEDEFYLYFNHSYHIICDESLICGKTDYGYEFASGIYKDNIFGFQPHPEKSHKIGLKILENFTEL